MKIINAEGGQMSGRVGNMIYYVRDGKMYARRARIPGKKRKWETEGRDERNAAAARRFGVTQRMYSLFAREVSPEIWRAAARARGMMAANLFHSLNFACVDGQGRLANPEAFRFSEGELTVPPGLTVAPAGGDAEGTWFEAAWEAEEEWGLAAPTDRLVVGVMYADDPLSTRLAAEVSGTRGELHGRFRLETGRGGAAHAYLFFAREDGAAFSPSRHFRLEA